MCARRNHFEHGLETIGQTTHRFQPHNVLIKLRTIRQLAIKQQVCHLFETRLLRQIVDVIAAVCERVVELGDVLAGRADVRQTGDNLVYYKNNTGLGMQFAAAGAVIYNKINDQNTNQEVPREWLASEEYAQS